MKTYYTYKTGIGNITLSSDNDAITSLKFGCVQEFGVCMRSPLTDLAIQQINQYLTGKLRVFNIPLKLCGTPFQLSVWNTLIEIPYGETRSYKQIAEAAGNPKACRAVGMANNRNPISIIIPCHRVIGSDGSLTGYGGGMELKQRLLNLEMDFKTTSNNL